MGMNWVRVEAQLASNPKMLQLTDSNDFRAISVWVFGLCYSGGHGLEGFIPRSALMFLHGRPKDAQSLVTVGLWHVVPGGWEINGWKEFQPTNDEVAARTEKAKRAAAQRWSREQAG
jgi:hypothetical protein